MDDFKEFVNRYVTLPENEWELIKAEFEPYFFQKNEIILEEGSVCRYFYFLEKGLVRFYCYVDGEDVTKSFCVAPYCFTSKASFRNQAPALESIQSLEKCVVWRITYERYKKLEKINAWNIFIRKLLNEIQEYMENRLLESKIFTAEKNYENLLERYPAGLIQKIPLKHLASFLGVAPQSLSRIRNNLRANRKS